MSDVKLRKNPETGEVFMWEPGQTDWRPVQARKNVQSGEVFVFGDGDSDWRSVGKYEGVQVRPQSRSKDVQQKVAAQTFAAPQQPVAASGADQTAPRFDRRALAQDLPPDLLAAMSVQSVAPGQQKGPSVDTSTPMKRGLQFEPFNPEYHEPQDIGLGGLSTEYLATESAPDGGFWNIPQIWWDREGNPKLFEPEQAAQIAEMYERETGRQFPRFSSAEEGSDSARIRSAKGGASNGRLATDQPGASQNTIQSDPLLSLLLAPKATPARGMGADRRPQPAPAAVGGAGPEAPVYDPFAGESFGALATRRGQEVAQGAAGVLSSVARARGIDDKTLADAIQRDAPDRVKEAARQAARFDDILARGVSDDGQSAMSAQERQLYTQRRDEAALAVEQWSDVQEFGPAFAGDRKGGAERASKAIMDWTNETFGQPPKDDSLWSELAYGTGSMIGFAAPAIAAGPAGLAVTAEMGSSAAKVEAYDRAKQAGASERDAQIAAQIMGFLGTAEALPIAHALNRIPESARNDVIGRIGRFISASAKGSVEEAVQEAGLAIGQNLTERGVYNPDRQIVDKDVGHQAIIGGILGGIMGGGANMAGLQSPRGKDDAPDPILQAMGATQNVEEKPIPRAAPVAPAGPAAGQAPQQPVADPDPEQPKKQNADILSAMGVAPEPAPAKEEEPENIRIMDETENVDGETVLTGRKVRVNLDTGEVSPVEEEAQRPPETDAVPAQSADNSVVGSEPAPGPVEVARQVSTGRQLKDVEIAKGQEVEVRFSGGPPVRGTISKLLQAGPVLREEDGTETQIPIEDMDDGETLIFEALPREREALDSGATSDRQNPVSVSERNGSKISVETLSTDEVRGVDTDAKTFQYKDGGDTSGVTDRLQGVTDWDERSAMGGIVYEYADGRRVVADGHQRLGLAKRLQENGVDTPWTVEVIREADGFSPADVRRIAALKNIREGSGTPIDAAKVLREAPGEADALNLPPNSALVRDARGLAKLSDDAFGAVVNGVVPESYGAVVGQHVADKALHADVIGLLAKLKPQNARQAAMIAQQAGQASVTETQTSLFGDEDVAESLYLERAKVLDNALNRIKQDRQTFKVLANRADTITAEGNVLDSEANTKRLETDAEMQAYLQAEANRKGPISDALTAAARDLKANPRQIARIAGDFLEKLRQEPGRVRPDRAGSDRAPRAVEGVVRPQEGEGRARQEETVTPPAAPEARKEEPQNIPATETTPEGEQSLIPGTREDQGRDTSRDRAEIEARANQSKKGTTTPQAGAGPLFGDEGGTQGDMFATKGDESGTKENLRREQRPLDMDPVASLTGKEIDGDNIRSLRETAQEWYRDNLLGTTATSREGWKVEFSNRGLRKSTSKGEGLLRFVPAIRGVIENGVLVDSRPGRDAGTQAMHFIAAPVEIAGQIQEIVVAVRETREGKFQYDLSWYEGGRAQGRGPDGNLAQAPISPVWNQPFQDINIGFLASVFNPRLDEAKIAAKLPDLRKELDRLNLKRVTLGVDARGKGRQGAFEANILGQMRILIGASLDEMATLHHEAVHAMRFMNLFLPAEWQALEAKAVQSWVEKHKITERYPDLLPSEQIEEAIAEEFADWARGNGTPKGGFLASAFVKVKRLLDSIRKVFRDSEFQSVEEIFDKTLSGEIGARDARNTGIVNAMAAQGQIVEGHPDISKEQRPEPDIPVSDDIKPKRRNRGDGSFSAKTVAKVKALNAIYGPPIPAAQIELPPHFPAPERTGSLAFKENWQDRFVMFSAAEAAISKQDAVPLPEAMSFSLKQNLFNGRVAARMQKVMSDEVSPLTRAMETENVSVDDLGLYLIAKHARERNAVMAKRDPERFGRDGGSGLANGAADALLEGFDAKKMTPKLEKLSKIVYAILSRDLKARRAAGLISESEYRDYTSMYKFYVPLRGAAERDDGGQIGRTGAGFDIRGKEVKAALGRSSLSENPLVQAIAMRQEGIVRVEKNRAGRALMRLVQGKPNAEIWEVVGKLPTRPILDPDTGLVRKIVDFGALREDEVLGVKIDGETHYIRIKDPLMAEAVKNLTLNKVGAVARVVMAARRTTLAFSRMATGLNPNFVIPNGFSDYLEGVWTAYDVDKATAKKMVRSYVKYYPAALYQGLRAEMSDSAVGRKFSGSVKKKLERISGGQFTEDSVGKFARYYDEWEMAGGRINFMAFRDLDEITRDINKKIESTGRRVWQKMPWEHIEDLAAVIEKVNQPVESAGRLAMYVAARENGLSKEKAASLSLDASGNYYRQGRYTRGMSAFYAFFNPAVQGMEKFARFAKKPKNMAIILGLTMANLGLASFNMLFWGDDDEPEGHPLYLDIPEWERSRSLIIPTGIVEETAEVQDENGVTQTISRKRLEYLSFRVPHNLRPFLTLGDQLAQLWYGFTDAERAATAFNRSVLMNNNPFGAETPWNMVAPTVVDPFVDISLNRTWSGAPVHPEDAPWNEGVPKSMQYYNSTSPAAVSVARALNWASSGGKRFESGFADVYPDDIEHLFDYVTGGLGRFLKQTAQMVVNQAQGVETKPSQVPVVRSVFGRTNVWAENTRYYDARKEEFERRNQLRAVKKATEADPSDSDAANSLNRLLNEMNVTIRSSGKFDWTSSTVKIFDDTDDLLKELRSEIVAVKNNDALSRRQKVEREDELRMEIEDAQRKARESYIDLLTKAQTAYGPL